MKNLKALWIRLKWPVPPDRYPGGDLYALTIRFVDPIARVFGGSLVHSTPIDRVHGSLTFS